MNLTAAYDIVWHQGLAQKLLRIIPDRHLVRFIMNILSNRSFKLKTSVVQIGGFRILKSVLTQGLTLSPILFNTFMSNIPTTVSNQYYYADDMALIYSHKRWPKVEETLSRDEENLADFLQTWRLKLIQKRKDNLDYFPFEQPRHTTATKHLRPWNHPPHNSHPKYLAVKLDKLLTYSQPTEDLRGKVMARNNFIRCLCGSTWDANAKTF